MASEWRQLIAWLNEGQHATIVLVFITAFYAYLTYRMAKSAARQATAMLQPALKLEITFDIGEESGTGKIGISNLGSQPIVLQDVQIRYGGRVPLIRRFEGLDEFVIYPRALDHIEVPFDFTASLPAAFFQRGEAGYHLRVVASDLSRQVAATYEYFPVLRHETCRLGIPLRVRFRYFLKPLKWRYHRVHHWLRDRFRKS
jgi:hypothetical protein